VDQEVTVATDGLSETPEDRVPIGGPPAVRSRRFGRGDKSSRSTVFLLLALVAEVAWLGVLGFALYKVLL
jgi:hypothetical protein